MNDHNIGKILIIGSGTMGSGITQACAQAGYETVMTETVPETDQPQLRTRLLKRAKEKIESNLKTLAKKGVLDSSEIRGILSRIRTETDLEEAVRDVDFVIEVVVENMEVKKALFQELDRLTDEHTIIASNTSSFKITEIGGTTNHQERVVGTHWWNPPYLMPLVEIVRGENTSNETVERTTALIRTLDKVPVICKDSPGFIGVRLQAALITEAIRMLEEGTASAEDIDTAVRMTLGLRLPIIGPLEIVDLGGADVFYYAYDYLFRKLGERFRPPKLLEDMVHEGKLGIKAGKGFYEYDERKSKTIVNNRDDWMIKQMKQKTDS